MAMTNDIPLETWGYPSRCAVGSIFGKDAVSPALHDRRLDESLKEHGDEAVHLARISCRDE